MEKRERRILWTLGFGALGACVNLFPVSVTPMVSFAFGAALGLVPGLAFGPAWGSAGVAITLLPLAVLRGSGLEIAYALIAAVVEAAVVSQLVYRRRTHAIGAALLFWAIAGPVVLCVEVEGASLSARFAVAGAGALNAVINALAAELILYSRSIQRRFFGRLLPARPLSLYITHLFVPLLVIPLIVVMAATGRLSVLLAVREAAAEPTRRDKNSPPEWLKIALSNRHTTFKSSAPIWPTAFIPYPSVRSLPGTTFSNWVFPTWSSTR